MPQHQKIPVADRLNNLTDRPSVEFTVKIRVKYHPAAAENISVAANWWADDFSGMSKPIDGIPATLSGWEQGRDTLRYSKRDLITNGVNLLPVHVLDEIH
jgi:hypothetical protein